MVAFSRSNQREAIFQAVQTMYTDVARFPEKTFHFPTGLSACLFVGYPEAELDVLPAMAVESFAGVGYPFATQTIQKGNRVLDVGSGAGTDAFLSATLVGSEGKVWGLDMTPAMIVKARANAVNKRFAHVEFREGNAERIPLPDAEVDVVTSNGVLNLVPNKPKAFEEIFRVLRPDGRIQISDIVLGKPIAAQSREDPTLWAECIVGAALESEYQHMLAGAGFTDVKIIGRLDYFSQSSEADTRRVAAFYGARSITLEGRKP